MDYAISWKSFVVVTSNSNKYVGKRARRLLQAVIFCAAFFPSSLLAQFDHSQWDSLLKKYVLIIDGGKATQLDYDGMLTDRHALQIYLDKIATVERSEFDSWPLDDQLAFLINTYNAWTVELILTEYPDLRSIRQIGFFPFSAWRRNIVQLFGENHSLDDVEHGMIRGWGIYQEPRIHFAVNCAAIGCPALRSEAYIGERLEEQLEDNTKLFLSDSSRNYSSYGQLYVSRIFDWYAEDFESGWQGVDSVSEFLSGYAVELELSEAVISQLRDNAIRIRFLNYDWNLNRTQ